eukprot:CAMPEP_0197638272 /NCGR_PEP_ID=MMETSP1338-20131121/13253_1 /TAXON_ID=43686 ORGANISM="Pelagodinium beii, Strain RCC1491" /NCGR_SAMPLE_ID=MMETSP1338 /ASSEMBLY_ACC=CAM_ASM_000754 /LENGTH=146 /DNA_ID=CAMNT_0043210825 /DNA_START=55 /DNA_END=495 /DNA_ORIENTATION=-
MSLRAALAAVLTSVLRSHPVSILAESTHQATHSRTKAPFSVHGATSLPSKKQEPKKVASNVPEGAQDPVKLDPHDDAEEAAQAAAEASAAAAAEKDKITQMEAAAAAGPVFRSGAATLDAANVDGKVNADSTLTPMRGVSKSSFPT